VFLVERTTLVQDHTTAVAEAFSRKARVYDAFGEDHPNLKRMRQQVREHTLEHLRSGDQILELNAGTGADAAYFASLGYCVHATDVSPGMIDEIETKIVDFDLGGRLTTQLCSFEALEQIQRGPFDFVFSNMGGLNCAVDLSIVARGIDRLLVPGGRITLVVMPPICPWELAQALRGDLDTAVRRLRPGGTLANVEGVRFMTWYYPPRFVMRAFGKGFRLLRLEGLSVITPPADHKAFAHHHPRLYRWLSTLDDRLAGRYPFNRWGDFYIMTLEKVQHLDFEA
jgi:ubiquinone/menaquinone biosynthesis C-methylase UbiE